VGHDDQVHRFGKLEFSLQVGRHRLSLTAPGVPNLLHLSQAPHRAARDSAGAFSVSVAHSLDQRPSAGIFVPRKDSGQW
jgi:hypothetical protein